MKSNQTTHFSVVDKRVTRWRSPYTLNTTFRTGIVVG